MPDSIARGCFMHKNNPWTEEKDAELRRLLQDLPELSCKEIGERLGFGSTGKNKVIGRMHRLGIVKTHRRINQHHHEPHEPYQRPPLKPIAPRPYARPDKQAKEPIKPGPVILTSTKVVPSWRAPKPPAPGDNAIHFIAAGPLQCKLPLWADDEKIGKVCGNPVVEGTSWCRACRPRVYGGRMT
jgi:hypothetical protein